MKNEHFLETIASFVVEEYFGKSSFKCQEVAVRLQKLFEIWFFILFKQFDVLALVIGYNFASIFCKISS